MFAMQQPAIFRNLNRPALIALWKPCLEPEAHAHDRPTLVRVIKKIVLVLVHIQDAITTDQGDLLVEVVAKAPKQLVRELRPASAHIKSAHEDKFL